MAARSQHFQGLGRIDTHHHCFPQDVPELAPEFAAISQSPQGLAAGLARMEFPESLEDHIKYMDSVGIQTAVMTPSIKSEWSLSLAPEEYKDLCRRSLTAQRQMVASNPLRFGAFALLPLPHIRETLDFLQEIATDFPDGFGLTTSLGKKYFAESQFEPVWAALNEAKATIFLHPTDTVMPPNLQWGPFVMEYPFDTCRCLTTILISGILTRYPDIKFLFSHNGGAFPFLAGRIGKQHLDATIAQNNNGRSLRDLLRTTNIFFDTAVSEDFQYPLVHDMGLPKDHIIYATDYPYTYRQDTKSYLDGYNAPKNSQCYTAAELDHGIVRNNALTYLFPRLAAEYVKLDD